MNIFYSDRFVPQLPEGHRFPIDKYRLVREQLLFEGTLAAGDLQESHPVAEEAIMAVHSPAYWKAVRDLQLSLREVRRIGFPQSAELVERSRRSVQGTLSAALAALETGIGLNLAGGTHHAYRDRGEGFCLLNDFAVTATYLLRDRQVRKILILDLDVHQGNGNAAIFANEDRVFSFSMHGKDNYPLRKEKSDWDIALPSATGDQTYLEILQRALAQLIEQQKPEFVLYQAGVDVLESDKLGKLSLSSYGCKTRDRIVLETCARYQIPVAVAMGGGYSQRLRDTVEAHANTFRVAREVFM